MSVNTHATTSCSCDMSTHATRRRFAQAHSPSTIFSAGVVSLSGIPNIEALRKGLDLALIWSDCIYFFCRDLIPSVGHALPVSLI